MVRLKSINTSLVLLLCAALLLIVPAGAVNTAIYGDTAGFNPDLHKDTFVVVYSLPGSSGTDFDTNVDKYTNASVDVIFIGGNDAFSAVTATRIEQAIFSGKILIVTYTSNNRFDASLPAANVGTATTGQSLVVTKPTTALSQEIFFGLSANYTNTTPPASREDAVARKGAVTLLSYDNNDPALIYWKYGDGYVIEWTLNTTASFMTKGEADTINYRLIDHLLKSQTPTPVPSPSITTLIPTTQPTTVMQPNQTPIIVPTGSVTIPPSTGNVTVRSSPVGANILIDGIFYGNTPGTITGIPQGNHILRLTLSGYYDYEGTIYIVPGQPSQAFGTLPPLSQYSTPSTPVPPTATPIIVTVPVTAQPTPTGSPLENPGVIAAIIGVITAAIGAAATIFTHINKMKKA